MKTLYERNYYLIAVSNYQSAFYFYKTFTKNRIKEVVYSIFSLKKLS